MVAVDTTVGSDSDSDMSGISDSDSNINAAIREGSLQ